MTLEAAAQQGVVQETAPSAPQPRQMEAQQPPRPRTPGYAPAFGSGSGAAFMFRDLASI